MRSVPQRPPAHTDPTFPISAQSAHAENPVLAFAPFSRSHNLGVMQAQNTRPPGLQECATLATPRQPHLPPGRKSEHPPPVFSDSHASFPMVHRQMLSSSTTSRPLSDLVIVSLAWRGRNLLRVRASISCCKSGPWGTWCGNLAARAPTPAEQWHQV